MLVVASVNVNGIRAAHRRGMPAWLEQRQPDVLLLQEVRADADTVAETLGEGWHVDEAVCAQRGRSGVAVAARTPLRDVVTTLPGFETAGRWVEATVGEGADAVRVVSVYVHSGEAGTERQVDKVRFLAAVSVRLGALRAQEDAGGPPVVVCGDINIGHTERDIKNWKGNRTKAGFLPEERAVLDAWYASGWVDVARSLAGDVDGPYSWWSWRGQAFDTDAGWRIDVHVATESLADRARSAEVDRAATYDARFSDHAPVVVAYAGVGEEPAATPDA
ncbi:exodeoxyribonuclease III [Aquipuribacter hungaricus]|uniref:Exodeoxyribonuclease III n=1 Tax=Aquipuribacter hungaricus TaxID=545624 RepID=A0ABV7WI70_9MICO